MSSDDWRGMVVTVMVRVAVVMVTLVLVMMILVMMKKLMTALRGKVLMRSDEEGKEW